VIGVVCSSGLSVGGSRKKRKRSPGALSFLYDSVKALIQPLPL
jgi:hypothetical protein